MNFLKKGLSLGGAKNTFSDLGSWRKWMQGLLLASVFLGGVFPSVSVAEDKNGWPNKKEWALVKSSPNAVIPYHKGEVLSIKEADEYLDALKKLNKTLNTGKIPAFSFATCTKTNFLSGYYTSQNTLSHLETAFDVWGMLIDAHQDVKTAWNRFKNFQKLAQVCFVQDGVREKMKALQESIAKKAAEEKAAKEKASEERAKAEARKRAKQKAEARKKTLTK